MKRLFVLAIPMLFVITVGFMGMHLVSAETQSNLPTAVYTVDTTSDYDPNLPTLPAYCTALVDCPLRAAVALANNNPGSTIEFDLPSNATITLQHGELLISDTVTIAGPGEFRLTIDSNPSSRIFNIDVPANAIVTIQELTIAGGTGSPGGNIYFRGPFSDLTAMLHIYTATIKEGSSTSGGNLYARDGTVILQNGDIRDGYGTSRGGGVYVDGHITMTNSAFTQNIISGTINAGDGGGLYVEGGNATILNSAFRVNISRSTSNGGDGGGVYVDDGDLILTDCYFRGNQSEGGGNGGDGGGVYVDDGDLTLTDCSFESNKSEAIGNGGKGGGVYVGGGNARFKDCYFESNQSKVGNNGGNGGAIFIDTAAGEVFIDDCNFFGNSTQGEFIGGNGGAIYSWSLLNISNTIFTRNTSTGLSQGHGGAIYGHYGNAQILGGSFTNNEALSGGAIYFAIRNCSPRPYNLIDSVAFDSNSAINNGGALFVSHACDFTIVNATFDSNHVTASDGCGGAISNRFGELSIENTTLRQNSAALGAAICSRANNVPNTTLQDTRLTVRDSTITNNNYTGVTTTTVAGGLFVEQNAMGVVSIVTVTGSTFNGNSADYGGGIVISGTGASASLTNSTISQNSASEGGGLYMANQSSAALRHVTTVINQAGAGGGIRSASGGSVTIENSILANNFVSAGGTGNANCDGAGIFGFGFNLDSDGTCQGFSMQNSNPTLAALADNGGSTHTHLPIVGSPVIDSAETSACTAAGNIDQRGYSRPGGNACDLGAVEADSSLPTTPTPTPTSTATPTPSNTSTPTATSTATATPGPSPTPTSTATPGPSPTPFAGGFRLFLPTLSR